jgi:hypothetical protein
MANLTRDQWTEHPELEAAYRSGELEALALLEGREPILRSEPKGGFLRRKPQGGHDV